MRLFWQLMVQELKLQTEDALQRDAKYLAKIKRQTSKNSLWEILRCVTSCKSIQKHSEKQRKRHARDPC